MLVKQRYLSMLHVYVNTSMFATNVAKQFPTTFTIFLKAYLHSWIICLEKKL